MGLVIPNLGISSVCSINPNMEHGGLFDRVIDGYLLLEKVEGMRLKGKKGKDDMRRRPLELVTDYCD